MTAMWNQVHIEIPSTCGGIDNGNATTLPEGTRSLEQGKTGRPEAPIEAPRDLGDPNPPPVVRQDP